MPDLIIPEEWLPIPDWAAYRISNRGRVQSLWKRRGCWGRRGTEVYLGDTYEDVKTNLAGGRLVVTLGDGKGLQKTFGVAYLVLWAFVRPPTEGEVARHYDDPTPTNCNITNLRWGTYSENGADIIRHKGKHHSSKLLPEQVRQIREALSREPFVVGKRRPGNPCKRLAAEYGVTEATIRGIEHGTSQKLVH